MARRNDAMKSPIVAACGSQENWPANQWWVGAFSDEIPEGKLVPRRLVGKSVVLYRTGDGRVAALENRCPHRAAPLSLGSLDGDNIICGYHGFQFAPSGRCVHIPTQDLIPPAAAVKAYPVREIAPLVWIWTGEQPPAPGVEPPDFAWLHEADWIHAKNYISVGANYMAVKENVLDLTHFGFVHAKSLNIHNWTNPPEVSVDDRGVRFENRFDRMTPIDARLSGVGDRPVDMANWGLSCSPAIHESGIDTKLLDPAPGERDTFTWRILHITTPETPRRTHYWWLIAQDYGHAIPELSEKIVEGANAAFDEDKVILEAMQAAADEAPGEPYVEISVKADTAALQARKQLADHLAEDRKAQSGGTSG